MAASTFERINALATRGNLAPATIDKRAAEKAAREAKRRNGPWEMSGPEEGDTIDQTVLVCHDGEEIITIAAGTLAQRKRIARRIAELLNEGEAVLVI